MQAQTRALENAKTDAVPNSVPGASAATASTAATLLPPVGGLAATAFLSARMQQQQQQQQQQRHATIPFAAAPLSMVERAELLRLRVENSGLRRENARLNNLVQVGVVWSRVGVVWVWVWVF